MKEYADDFLEKVETEGILKETFVKYYDDNEDVPFLIEDVILIYEYKMNESNYEIVIHKSNQDYVNYYFRII